MAAGLCETCEHCKRVASARGSVFYLCQLHDRDSRFAKYPRLPMTRCPGYLEQSMSPADPNANQIEFWNGPAAERWVRDQTLLDRAFAPFATRLLAEADLRRGQRVLDVGCGAGTTTLAAAQAVDGGGTVMGIDVSAPLLDRARIRSEGCTNVTYVRADAATHRFDVRFDVALSRFGVMFFREPAAAFMNLRTALRPGGRLVFVCWRSADENEWARVPYQVAVQHVTPDPPAGPEEPGPFSFGDRARIERILAEAGFSPVSVEPFDADVVLSEEGLDAAVLFAMSNGPTGRMLREAPDEPKVRIRQELEAKMRPLVEGDRVVQGGSVWIVSASAPE